MCDAHGVKKVGQNGEVPVKITIIVINSSQNFIYNDINIF